MISEGLDSGRVGLFEVKAKAAGVAARKHEALGGCGLAWLVGAIWRSRESWGAEEGLGEVLPLPWASQDPDRPRASRTPGGQGIYSLFRAPPALVGLARTGPCQALPVTSVKLVGF